MYTSSISAAGTLTGGSVDDSRTMLFKQSLPKLQAPPSPVSTAGAGAGSAGQSSPAAYTPRKYLKILSHVLKTLVKHHAKLSVEFLEALKDLEAALNQAAHPYSTTATGKLHYYLMEDLELQQLHDASSAVCRHIQAAANMSRHADPDFQADLQQLADKLSGAKCVLPSSQMHLIDAFRNLCHNLDPAYDIPDGVQKAAEQVVREVIKEVHGPFFNSEILETEVSFLVRIAARIDPNTQRLDAAAVKLLASTLLNLDGDESDEEDFDVPGADSDPFLIPSFPPTLRVLDPSSLTPSAAGGVTVLMTDTGPLKSGLGTGELSPYGPRFASVSGDIGRSAPAAAAAAATNTAAAAAPPSVALGTTTSHTSSGPLMTTSQFVASGRVNFPLLDLDATSPDAGDSAMSSPTPSAASLAAAAAYEQQQLYAQNLYWQQQQQQRQQQRQQQQQQQDQLPPNSRLPPRSPRQRQQQQQQQLQVPPLPLQQLHNMQDCWQQQQQLLQEHHNMSARSPGPIATRHPAGGAYETDPGYHQQLQHSQQLQQQQQPRTAPTNAAASYIHPQAEDDMYAHGAVGQQLPAAGAATMPEASPSAAAAAAAEAAAGALSHALLLNTQQPGELGGDTTAATSSSNSATNSNARMLKDFIDTNMLAGAAQASRDACTFSANMKLLDEGVEKLARFIESTKRVRGLSLAHNNIGPLGAQRLCKAMLVHRTVQSLDLPDNSLGDVGAAAIADLLEAGCKVTTLQLSDNDIGDVGMIRLAQSIERCGQVERLSVYNNRIGAAGCRALVAAVKANRSLKMVEFLPGNNAATRDIKMLAEAVKRNRRFRLRNLFTNACMQA